MATNTATAKREYIDRAMSNIAEQDALKEDLKELWVELKSREDELGFTAKEIKEAVALKRKGIKATVDKVKAALATLDEAGVQEAIDAAFQ